MEVVEVIKKSIFVVLLILFSLISLVNAQPPPFSEETVINFGFPLFLIILIILNLIFTIKHIPVLSFSVAIFTIWFVAIDILPLTDMRYNLEIALFAFIVCGANLIINGLDMLRSERKIKTR